MAKEINIIGVLGPMAIGGFSSGKTTKWCMSLELLCWRVKGEALNDTPLRVYKEGVTSSALDAYQRKLHPYDIVALRGVLRKKRGSTYCDLVRFVRPSRDEEMAECAKSLQAPIKLKDDFFGTLTYDRGLQQYECKAGWNGKRVRVSFRVEQEKDLRSILELARRLWKAQKSWDKRVRDFAVARLLPLKNECWLDDYERKVTSKRFRDRMKLESIAIYPDGEFEFWHDDGDLFWGHSILVSGSLRKGPTSADIPG